MKKEEIIDIILKYIEKKKKIPEGTNLDSFDFVQAGYVDSMGFFMFTVELEERFDIYFSEDELKKVEFRTIGGLTDIIQNKLS